VSFMERRAESEGAESEGVPLCVFVGRGAILIWLHLRPGLMSSGGKAET
jgi:hypothetical protein